MMNETRLSYGSSRNGAGKVGGQQSIGGGLGSRNVSNPRDARASQAVNDWASKKKEQIERAKMLREQRKHGSSHLKSAGETQMTPQSTNMRTSQHSGSQQPFGSINHLQPPQYDPQQYGQNYNEYLSEGKGNGGRHSPMYGSNMRQQNHDFNSMYDQNSTPQNRQFEGMTSNGQYSNFGDQPLNNDNFLRKQYSYGNTPMEQDNGRHHTISHDLPRGGPSYNHPQHQLPGSNPGTELKTTFSGGFSHNPLSRRAVGGGGYQNLNHTTDHDQARYMRSTAYSKQDVQEARDGLKLLKNRMDNLGNRKGISNSQSTNRERPDPSGFGGNSQNQSMNYMSDKYSRRSTNMNHQANKPPMMPPSASQANPLNYSNMDPMNTSALSGNGGPTPQNKQQQNYRRAFKPNIPTANSNPGSQFSENPINNRQSLKVSQQESSYEPEKRSPMLRRNVSNSNKQNNRKQPPPQPDYSRAGFDSGHNQQQYDDMHADPFGQRVGPPRVANSPKAGVRPSPIIKSQPKQSNFGAPANIYEQAAMNANPDSNPNGELADDGTRIPCPTCGRKFNEAALQKHVKICKKVFVQKRQAFDVKAARAPEGIEEIKQSQQQYSKPFGQKAKPKPREEKAIAGKPMPKWKAQSLMFRQAMKAANGGGSSSGAGGGLDAQAAAQLAAHQEQMDDRITCQFCNRKFAEESGKRHIPHCERKYKENMMKNGGKPKAPTKRGTQVGFGKQR